MQQRPWSKWSTIAGSIREAHLRCAGHNCFSEVIFGLRFLGQTWKKASWESARQSGPLSARLTRNTSLGSIRLTRRSVLRSTLGNLTRCNCAGCPSADTAARTDFPQRFQGAKLRSPAVVETLGAERFFITAAPELRCELRADRTKEENGNGSSTTGTGKMEKGKIQTQTGKSRERSGT